MLSALQECEALESSIRARAAEGELPEDEVQDVEDGTGSRSKERPVSAEFDDMSLTVPDLVAHLCGLRWLLECPEHAITGEGEKEHAKTAAPGLASSRVLNAKCF